MTSWGAKLPEPGGRLRVSPGMRRIAVLAAIAALAFAACGGDDESRRDAGRHRGRHGNAHGGRDRDAPPRPRAAGREAGDRRRPGRRAEVHRDRAHRQGRQGRRSTSPTRPSCRTPSTSRATASRRAPRPSPAMTRRRSRSTSSPGVHVLLPGRRPPRRGHGGQAHGKYPGSRRSARGRAPRTRGARSRRAARTAARSGRCRASAVPLAVGLELVRVVPERVRAVELGVDEALARHPLLDPRQPADRQPVQLQPVLDQRSRRASRSGAG